MKKILKFCAKVFIVIIVIPIIAFWYDGKKQREAYERLIVCENEDSVCDYIFNHPEHTYRIEELKAHARTLGNKLKRQEDFEKSLNDGTLGDEILKEVDDAVNEGIVNTIIVSSALDD